ncbi:DUF397 domain-containing protein [Streptomyces sp. NPDC046465]|uniref:DUF397 domain-containing protein n=1 Tax=Streptomyces sp. NPDC046465 TaxID=3155810 RepID=UPI0033EF54ED
MNQLRWQKSSFSGGGEGECVELADGPTGHVHLRESDRPTEATTVTPRALSRLLQALRTDGGPALRG